MSVRAWTVEEVANGLINAISKRDEQSAARHAAMLIGKMAEDLNRVANATERLTIALEELVNKTG
jgi:Zn-dependent protease with chaperone function